ncbi:MAG: hypothetical protein ACQRW7_01300 [Caulobacterales bacterium]|uniref:hypothetical protein n=1 Tax=Glycocaulis sp. TaxID=1969725 RepID=UPI003F9F8D1F
MHAIDAVETRPAGLRPGAGSVQCPEGADPMAALIALGLCFGLFALFNLIEFKRLD